MRSKAALVIDEKISRNDGSIIQIVVWELPIPLRNSRHRYKYRLYFGKNGKCIVRFDNEQGKGDHKHINDIESPYPFIDIPGLMRDFGQAIREYEENP
jgi:hypothetical protein